MRLKLFAFLCALLVSGTVSAQCPGCIPNMLLCDTTSGPCPNFLDTAFVTLAYEDTITFRLPRQVDASQQSGGLFGWVDFVEFKINSISGLPFGVNWSCDLGNCTYTPSAFPNGTAACVRFCGTPLAPPGVYPITINTTGTVNTPFGNQSGVEIFNMNLVVMPPPSGGNADFSFNPPFGCNPLLVSFTNNNPSVPYAPNSYNTGITYAWDFANGQQSSDENPAPVTYSNPGSYVINYQQVVDTLPFVLDSVTLFSVNCTDVIIGGITFDSPDIFLRIFDGNGQEALSTQSNLVVFPPNASPHVWQLSLPLVNQPYNIEVWDEDGGLFGSNDNCFDNTTGPFPFTPLTMPPASQYNVPVTFVFNQNGLNFNWHVSKLALIKQSTDTLIVNATPPSVAPMLTPGTISCDRDSIRLDVPGGYFYTWYKDSVPVYSGPNSSFFAKTNGRYHVMITDTLSGCSSLSPDTQLTFNPAPPPGFPNVGATYSNGILGTPLGSGYTFQWIYFNGSEWQNIPAPLGVISTLTPTQEGIYALIATNSFGCSDTSNHIIVNDLGLTGIENLNFVVFPNPASSPFFLRYPAGIPGAATVGLRDMSGRLIWSERYFMESSGGDLLVASELAGGSYILEIVTEFGIRRFKVEIIR
jgi:hypothetical protein